MDSTKSGRGTGKNKQWILLLLLLWLRVRRHPLFPLLHILSWFVGCLWKIYVKRSYHQELTVIKKEGPSVLHYPYKKITVLIPSRWPKLTHLRSPRRFVRCYVSYRGCRFLILWVLQLSRLQLFWTIMVLCPLTFGVCTCFVSSRTVHCPSRTIILWTYKPRT